MSNYHKLYTPQDSAVVNGSVNKAAWKTKPSWYLVATDDKMIPPATQQFMAKRAGAAVVNVAGSHAVYVSQPEAVAALFKTAAQRAGTGK